MNWNKEKLTLGAAIVLAAGFIATGLLGGNLGGEDYESLVREPRPGSLLGAADESIEWFVAANEGDVRDPFLPISDWKPASIDLLPTPPTPGLYRRLPVPGHLADSLRALPMKERVRPVSVEEEGD